MKKIILFLDIILIILLGFSAISCGNEKVFIEYQSIEETKGWLKSDKKIFTPEIKDTLGVYDIFVHVRHADSYPYRNLYIFLTTEFPNGKKESDTLECILANEKNQWLGSGAGDLWDNAILLKSDVQFPVSGKYCFTFEQGMRMDPVPLILDVGLSIEKPKIQD